MLGETGVQLVRGLAPLSVFALGLAFERLMPHATLRPAWRANLGLWVLDTVVMAVVCGTCGWAVAAWGRAAGVGALNALGAPVGLGIVVTIAALDAGPISGSGPITNCACSGASTASITPTTPSTSRRRCASTRASSCSRFPCDSPRSSRWGLPRSPSWCSRPSSASRFATGIPGAEASSSRSLAAMLLAPFRGSAART